MDTDVFSFMFGGDSRADRYRPHLEGRLAGLSFQSIAELLQGAFQNNWGERRIGNLRDAIDGFEGSEGFFDALSVYHESRQRKLHQYDWAYKPRRRSASATL